MNADPEPDRLGADAPAEAERARFGVTGSWSFVLRHRVRWSECDPFGHANHRAYFEWFEDARNHYLEAVGLGTLARDRPGPVIAETTIRYRRPLAYRDALLVGARTARLGRTSFDMEYSCWHDGVAAEGRAVLILIVNATGLKIPLPDGLRARILAHEAISGHVPVDGASAAR